MTKKWRLGDPYQFSRREIARHRCLDCGVNVIKAGDFCMIGDSIWRDQFGLGWSDNLCIACIEKRLGRPLRPLQDIFPAQGGVEGYPSSAVLLNRLGFKGRKQRSSADR
jgi:hypothetical protein